ncbi:unnamed protein product [Oikopleura dioica]|uniref:Phosphatidylinositol-glycan biosynthesis class W protein n=1 Tax=Oikopleura dioica TaxID=34765 RepID=E4XIX8_OIKDI|nr:unnamed protein product [Oikopleura dioica]
MKTHKFGASVMDIGVGAFVAANAFASSDAKYKNLLLSVPKLFKKVFPLLVVGFIRWASTAGTGYHVDPTEYGIHWNFFMSLAIVHTVSITIIRNFSRTRPGFLALIVLVTYEIALRKLDLYNLVFGPDRSSFFLANKEGILGSIGLTALYLLYVELGRIILPKIKSNESILKDVTGLCLLFWLLVIFLHSIGIEPSRRLSNLGYVVWIAAMAMSFLLFCTIGEIARVRMRVSQPRLINDLNRTMLPVFLLANIFTGLVNFSIETHKQTSLTAHFIMIIYLLFVSTVAWGICRNEKLLRFVRSLFGGPPRAKTADVSISALPFSSKSNVFPSN